MVGVFYRGDGLGINHSIILNPDHTFIYQQWFCTGEMPPAEGEFWCVRGQRQLVLRFRKDQPEEIVFTIARVDGELSFYDSEWEKDIATRGATDGNVFRRVKLEPEPAAAPPASETARGGQ